MLAAKKQAPREQSAPIAAEVRAKKREIAVRYAWQTTQRYGADTDKVVSHDRLITLRRLRELERLYRARYRGPLIDDGDASREYIEIAAHHIGHLRGEVERHIVQWCEVWAPWLPSTEAKEIAKRVAKKSRKWTATSLGNDLNLTEAERAQLEITTIGAAGTTKAERAARRQQRKAQAARASRERKAASEGRTLRPKCGRPPKADNALKTFENKCVGTRVRVNTIGAHAFPTELAEQSAASVSSVNPMALIEQTVAPARTGAGVGYGIYQFPTPGTPFHALIQSVTNCQDDMREAA